MEGALASPWGRLFRNWETVTADANGYPDVGTDAAQIEMIGSKAFVESIGILGTCIKEAPEFASRKRHAETKPTSESPGLRTLKPMKRAAMTDMQIRSDNVDVEQIMRQIRSRIREKRGVDYTEEEIKELARVKLEKFLDPTGVRSDLLAQFRRTKAEPDATRTTTSRTPRSSIRSHAIVRFIRRMLRPILKLFFNVNPLIDALHIQSELECATASAATSCSTS